MRTYRGTRRDARKVHCTIVQVLHSGTVLDRKGYYDY